MITAQQILDKNYEVFVKEKRERCTQDSGSGCLYKKKGHPGCAIGCVLTQEQVEGIAKEVGEEVHLLPVIEELLEISPLTQSLFSEVNDLFLGDLQSVHDIAINRFRLSKEATAAKYLEELIDLANLYNIDWVPPVE